MSGCCESEGWIDLPFRKTKDRSFFIKCELPNQQKEPEETWSAAVNNEDERQRQ